MTHLRSFLLFFLCLLPSVFCLLPFAHAELPDISVALEAQLYQGSAEDVTAFIDKRQKQVDDFIAQIIAKTQSNQKDKETAEVAAFTSLLDLFQGLSFQLKNLKAELARTDMAPMALPSLNPPPYSLASFDELVSFQHKAAQQLSLYEELLAYGAARVAALTDELSGALPLYAKEKEENATGVQAYEKLAHIFTMQNEYALFQLKKPKITKALSDLQRVVKEARALAEQVFGQLRISPEDITAQKKKLEILNEESGRSLARLNGESLELNKQNVVVGAKLDKVVTDLTIAVKGEAATDGLENEKERLDLALLSIKTRQRAITQEKMGLEFALKSMTFRQEWIAAYVDMVAGKMPVGFIETWRKMNEVLNEEKDALVRDLALATHQRSDMNQRLVALAGKVDRSGNIDSQAVFSKQAVKTTDNLEFFVLNITDNVQRLSLLQKDIDLILQLLRNKMDSGERILSWWLGYLHDKWEKVSAVLFYPLFTLGGVDINLTVIGKALVLLLIGMRLLRIIRRKMIKILSEKTAMAPGTANSLSTLAYYASLVVGVLMILSLVGFHVSQLGIVFGALGVGIGFGLQTVFNNFISGIILLTEQTIQVGDFVQLQTGIDGLVRKITIRATIVRTFDGEDIIVPNSEFVSSRVNTWTYGDNWRRLKIPFGVSYGSDPEEVARLAIEAAREVKVTKEDNAHPLRVFFEGFGNNSLDFSIRPWCWMDQIHAHTGMISDYYFALFKKLKEAGIEIPFPQTDLHVKSVSPEVLAVLQELTRGSAAAETGGSNKVGGAQG